MFDISAQKGSAMFRKDSGQRIRRPQRLALVSALALLVGVASAPLPASAASNAEVESSIVLIGTTWSGYIYIPDYIFDDGVGVWTDEITASSFCTGWFASAEGHIVTAGHCVDPSEGRTALLTSYLAEVDSLDSLDDAIVNWTVEGDNDGDPVKRVVQVIQPNDVEGAIITNNAVTAQIVSFRGPEEGDLALLHVSGIKATPALTVAPTHPANGDGLTAVGFPGSVSQVMDGTRIHASFKSGTASSRQFSADGGIPTTEINADLSPGMSGGPTINDKGEVLGVNSFVLADEERNFNFITDTDSLETFLKTNDVNYTPAPIDNGSRMIVTVLVVVFALLLAVGLVLFFLLRKRNVVRPVIASAGSYNSPSLMLLESPEHQAPTPAAPVVDRPDAVVPQENVPNGVYCPSCGTHYTNSSKFCSKDGTILPND